jgi:hypothetical protein
MTMMAVPSSVRSIRPTPPESRAPPSTTTLMAEKSRPTPMDGLTTPVRTIESSPATAAKAPQII